MIRGIQNGVAVVFYFLQPDKHGNLILRGKETIPTSTNRYIVEEYHPFTKPQKSFITPSWIGYSKTFTWKPKLQSNKHLIKNDRSEKIFDILLRIFGYTDSTHPTIEKIKRMTKGYKDGKMDFDMQFEDLEDDPSDPTEYYPNNLKDKYKYMLRSEKLLTDGKFESNSFPAISRKKKILKPKIKKRMKTIKCRCKNE